MTYTIVRNLLLIALYIFLHIYAVSIVRQLPKKEQLKFAAVELVLLAQIILLVVV